MINKYYYTENRKYPQLHATIFEEYDVHSINSYHYLIFLCIISFI